MKRKLLFAFSFVAVLLVGIGLGRISSPKSYGLSQLSQSPVYQFINYELDEKWAIFQEEDLLEKLNETGRPYLPFFKNHTLSTGIYTLNEGAKDGQQPHKLDEVYYTLKGKCKFTVDGNTVEVRPGTILFVKAEIDHEFHDIEEDVELLVFFSNTPTE